MHSPCHHPAAGESSATSCLPGLSSLGFGPAMTQSTWKVGAPAAPTRSFIPQRFFALLPGLHPRDFPAKGPLPGEQRPAWSAQSTAECGASGPCAPDPTWWEGLISISIGLAIGDAWSVQTEDQGWSLETKKKSFSCAWHGKRSMLVAHGKHAQAPENLIDATWMSPQIR